MQNPFRHHDDPHRPERDRDEGRWEARDRRPDEYRTWGGGDGGRTAEAFRREEREYGRQPSGPAGAWTQDNYQQNQYARREAGGYSTGDPSYGGAPQYGRDHGGSRFDRGYGGQNQGGDFGGPTWTGQSQADHGYAPGGQIWQGSGRGMGGQSHEHHDFEPDYLHWREQQLSAFDRDYADWRDERRQKFSSDFDTWRQNRPRSEASGDRHTPAENPIVGDVADGGTGDASEAKKR